jgi:glycosyltransferase involved in cell wall biosynthesis
VSLRVLHAIHDFLPRHRAGSEIYAYQLCRELARRHHVTVLCAEYDPARAHGSVTWRLYEGLPVVEVVNNWAFRSFDETYRSVELNRVLQHALTAVDPDVLHVHNLLNLSMDLPALARARGVRTVATLHDYTLLCPSGGQRVHMAEEHVCHTIDTARCSRCFPQSPFASQMAVSRVTRLAAKSPGVLRLARFVRRRLPRTVAAVESRVAAGPLTLAPADIERRLAYVRERVFDAIDLFVAPSQALADEYIAAGLPAARIKVADYGFVPLSVPPRRRGDVLRIGFVGTLVWHKGAHVLIEAVAGLPAGRVELKLFGDPNVFPAYTARLREQARDLPIRFMGGFDAATMPEAYGQIDVLVVPSLWPENSPLVIHEAFMAGIPVVGARQGGIPELVTDGVNGLVYDAYSPAALQAALRRILDDPSILDRFARALPAVRSIEEDAAGWEAVYETLVKPAAPGGSPSS